MTPADRDEFRRMLRDELARARVDIVAESKRHVTDSDHDAEAAHGAAIVHERMAMRSHVETELAPIRRRLAHWTRNPWVDLAIRVIAYMAATYAAVSAAK